MMVISEILDPKNSRIYFCYVTGAAELCVCDVESHDRSRSSLMPIIAVAWAYQA